MSSNLEVCCDPDCKWFQISPNSPSEPMFEVRCLKINPARAFATTSQTLEEARNEGFIFSGSVEAYNRDKAEVGSWAKSFECLAPDFKAAKPAYIRR